VSNDSGCRRTRTYFTSRCTLCAGPLGPACTSPRNCFPLDKRARSWLKARAGCDRTASGRPACWCR
jgi:hypothetical protein